MSDSTLHPAHPEVELLADHAEELLSAEQSAELTAHLASCAECQETYQALAELTALLGDEPGPGPMPQDVADRIDAALAAERENPSPVEAGAEAVGVGEGPAVALAGNAAEAGASAGAEDADPTVGSAGGDRGRPTRRPAGDRPEDNRPKTRTRRSVRMRRMLTTLALFAAAGGIGIAVSRGGDLDSGDGNTAASGARAYTAPASSAAASPAYDFTQANLAGEVQRLASDSGRLNASGRVNGAASASGAPSPSVSPSGGVGHMTPYTAPTAPADGAQPVAPACVLAATKRTDNPSVQGLGHYLGVEVFALLYPDANDPAHRWDVYLVQDSCSAPLVMLHQSVPRA